jgi:hypothetical protein
MSSASDREKVDKQEQSKTNGTSDDDGLSSSIDDVGSNVSEPVAAAAAGGSTSNNMSTSTGGAPSGTIGMNELARQLQLLTSGARSSAAKDVDEAKRHKYAFWETQPVPQFHGK